MGKWSDSKRAELTFEELIWLWLQVAYNTWSNWLATLLALARKVGWAFKSPGVLPVLSKNLRLGFLTDGICHLGSPGAISGIYWHTSALKMGPMPAHAIRSCHRGKTQASPVGFCRQRLLTWVAIMLISKIHQLMCHHKFPTAPYVYQICIHSGVSFWSRLYTWTPMGFVLMAAFCCSSCVYSYDCTRQGPLFWEWLCWTIMNKLTALRVQHIVQDHNVNGIDKKAQYPVVCSLHHIPLISASMIWCIQIRQYWAYSDRMR